MKRLFFFLLFALFLSGAFASCYAPTFSPQALKVESDSCFYGSSTGQVVVDVNVESLSLLSKEVYLKIVGLEKYTSVSLSSIKLTDDSSTKTVKTKLKPLESDDKIKFDSFKKYQMELVIDFNVDEVGIGQEFDIQFVDAFGFLVINCYQLNTAANTEKCSVLVVKGLAWKEQTIAAGFFARRFSIAFGKATMNQQAESEISVFAFDALQFHIKRLAVSKYHQRQFCPKKLLESPACYRTETPICFSLFQLPAFLP